MSAIAVTSARCSVCRSPLATQIDGMMRNNSTYAAITRWLQAGATTDPSITVLSKDRLSNHRLRHLGLAPLTGAGGRNQALIADRSAEPPDTETFTAHARRELDARLSELSADKLHTLVLEGMRLERARLEDGKPASEPVEPAEPVADADAEEARRALKLVGS